MDLPLYVLDDPEPQRRDENDGERAHTWRYRGVGMAVGMTADGDGTLEVTLDTRRKVTREVRRLRPEVIVAPDPSRLWSGNRYVNHSDHKAAGMLALSTVMPDAPTRVMFQELEAEGIEPFEVPNLWLSSNEPDTYVDISDTIDVKIKSLEQHVSQGGADAEPWVRLRAQQTGEETGYPYAEAFKTFRFVDEPPAVEDE